MSSKCASFLIVQKSMFGMISACANTLLKNNQDICLKFGFDLERYGLGFIYLFFCYTRANKTGTYGLKPIQNG